MQGFCAAADVCLPSMLGGGRRCCWAPCLASLPCAPTPRLRRFVHEHARVNDQPTDSARFHSARAVPVQCPYSARTVPVHSARWKNTALSLDSWPREENNLLILSSISAAATKSKESAVFFQRALCTGTVRALYGHCAGTVRALSANRPNTLVQGLQRSAAPTQLALA